MVISHIPNYIVKEWSNAIGYAIGDGKDHIIIMHIVDRFTMWYLFKCTDG